MGKEGKDGREKRVQLKLAQGCPAGGQLFRVVR